MGWTPGNALDGALFCRLGSEPGSCNPGLTAPLDARKAIMGAIGGARQGLMIMRRGSFVREGTSTGRCGPLSEAPAEPESPVGAGGRRGEDRQGAGYHNARMRVRGGASLLSRRNAARKSRRNGSVVNSLT